MPQVNPPIPSRQELEPYLEDVFCFRCDDPGIVLLHTADHDTRQCPHCTQIFTTPALSEEGRQTFYDDVHYLAEAYGYPTWRFEVSRRLQNIWTRGRLNLIERFIGETSGREMLEIGSAYGLFLANARDQGFVARGHEFSKAIARGTGEVLGSPLYDGDLETAGIPDDSFNIICFWDVIEHTADPRKFLEVVRNKAVSGAVIALSCPNFDSLPARGLRQRRWTLKPGEHIWQFTPETLGKLMDETGMQLRHLAINPLRAENFARLDSMVAVGRVE
jgi:SAM-dependent methyltransferase